ncbi:tyrosine-type recombinase/integrase [Glaciecola siphonariae]|uniref:Tyrosine-type recombinase/integrase n=1 Tax=Glaciecola siphonariae TaxID=521012 RepID=A0ABV9LSB2_9ALTE
MPRRRIDSSLAWMPARVYIQRDKYVYQPKSGGKITLCKISEGKLACIKRYEQVVESMDDRKLFKRVIDLFFASDAFKRLSVRTRKDYEVYRPVIVSAFGKMRPNAIQPHHVRLFMDKLAKSKGTVAKPANATANRHKALMQKICSWAYERGKIKINPCVGVVKLHEQSRSRYITDKEYEAIYDAAVPSCRVAMEISYLCMARISDVVNLKMNNILDEGIYIEQGKTGKKQIKLWSERLRKAVDDAKALPCKPGMFTMFLFNKPDGSRYAVRAIQAQYKKACVLAGVEGVTLHDLKSKAISDFEGTLQEKQDAAGHSNSAMTQKYDRKIKHVRSVK